MIETKKYLWPLLIGVAIVQSAALAKIVWDRDRLIKNGREIAMQVLPVDPRDLFRGDYVILGYGISPIRETPIAPDVVEKLRTGSAVYVTLRSDADNVWKPVAVGMAYPETTDPQDVVLKGRVTSIWQTANKTNPSVSVSFGIEKYFVPEGTGKPLEQAVRDKKIQAIVAVGPDGAAALKGLIVGGERREAPPLL